MGKRRRFLVWVRYQCRGKYVWDLDTDTEFYGQAHEAYDKLCRRHGVEYVRWTQEVER